MNDEGQSQNSIKIACYIQRLDKTSTVMATAPEI